MFYTRLSRALELSPLARGDWWALEAPHSLGFSEHFGALAIDRAKLTFEIGKG